MFRKYLFCLALVSSPLAQAHTDFEIHGGLDAYFQTSPEAHPSSTSGPLLLEGRSFDRWHNSFVLNLAEVSVRKTTNSFSWRVDLGAGDMTDMMSGGISARDESTRNILQALIQIPFQERWSLTVGKFFTPIGYEGTRAQDNLQYSRSYLFNYGPFWHQGLILTYKAIPETLQASVYIINSWEGRLSQETNDSPATILNLGFTPSSFVTANYNYYQGKEGLENRWRQLHELNASWHWDDKHLIAADFQYGSQQISNQFVVWSGLALYFQKKISDRYSLSPRFEYFTDTDGLVLAGALSAPSTTQQNIRAWTLTNTFRWEENLETRFELRHDQSDSEGFFLSRTRESQRTQSSATLALLYSF